MEEGEATHSSIFFFPGESHGQRSLGSYHETNLVQPWNKTRYIYIAQFSHSIVPDSLWPHGLQHTRPPCPSPTHGACSNSWALSQWCHPSISSSVIPFSSCLQSFPSIRVFSNEAVLHIRWPKYWSFSINLSSEYSVLISFRIDWLDLLVVQGTLKSLLQHHSSKHNEILMLTSSRNTFTYTPQNIALSGLLPWCPSKVDI